MFRRINLNTHKKYSNTSNKAPCYKQKKIIKSLYFLEDYNMTWYFKALLSNFLYKRIFQD